MEKSRYNNLYEEVLLHSGIKGMKWGVRRYQNPDGSLTPAGRIHYAKRDAAAAVKAAKIAAKADLKKRKISEKTAYAVEKYKKQLADKDPDVQSARKEAAKKQRSEATKKAVGEFVRNLGQNVAQKSTDLLKEIGKEYIEKQLGLGADSDILKKAEKQAKLAKANYEVEYFRNKKDDEIKRRNKNS